MRYLVLFIFYIYIISGAAGVFPFAYSQQPNAVPADCGGSDCSDLSGDLFLSPFYDSYLLLRNENSIRQLQIRQEQLEVLFNQPPQSMDEYGRILRLLADIRKYSLYLALDENDYTDKAASVIKEAMVRAGQEEAAGNWKQSYESVYQWLALDDPVNPDYITHAVQLAEAIVLLRTLDELKSGLCATNIEQITPEFADSLFGMLERSYVHLIDYQNLADRVFRRCQLLGKVLLSSTACDGLYVKDNVGLWIRNVEDLHSGINPNQSWTRKEYLSALEDILAANRQTLCLSDSILLYLAIQASLQSLDMHTMLLDPWEWQNIERQISNQYGGIGIKLARDNGGIRIDNIYPGSPAACSNLRLYDRIININGKPSDAMDIQEVLGEITGPVDTKIDMLVQNIMGNEQEVTLRRRMITIPTITGWCRQNQWNWNYMLSQNIGYIRIQSFSQTTDSEFKIVLHELERNAIEGLILDLRSNSGGDVESAVSIADYFVDSGLILRSQPRCGSPKYYMAHRDDIHPSYPIVILINNNTASAAEILAGCLSDSRQVKTVLVGERTFGKNTIQTISSVSRTGFKIKYSSAVYHFSSGRALTARSSWMGDMGRQYGLSPDLEIPLLPHEIQEIGDVDSENLSYVWDYGSLSDSQKEYFLQKILHTDPQLAFSLFLMKNHLVRCSLATALQK